jgi:hypothetical protein
MLKTELHRYDTKEIKYFNSDIIYVLVRSKEWKRKRAEKRKNEKKGKENQSYSQKTYYIYELYYFTLF